MSRNAKMGALVLVAIVVVVAVFTTLAQGQGMSSQDAALRRAAYHLRKTLSAPDQLYEQQGSFLNAFDLYQHNEQLVLISQTRALRHQGLIAQVGVWESQTMPGVWRLLQLRSQPTLAPDGNLVQQALDGKSVFTTVTAGNRQYRAYLTPLTPPAYLQQNSTRAVIEVFRPTS